MNIIITNIILILYVLGLKIPMNKNMVPKR